MARRPFQSDPKYRLYKQSGQAVVTLPDGMGGRKDFLLSPLRSPESRAEYRRLLAEWEANDHRLPAVADPKELTMFAIVYNLVRSVMHAAALRQEVAVERMSFADALG